MEEKCMVNDFILDLKCKIKEYTDYIVEIENIEFRNQVQSMRNDLESLEINLVKIALSKGYYDKNKVLEA